MRKQCAKCVGNARDSQEEPMLFTIREVSKSAVLCARIAEIAGIAGIAGIVEFVKFAKFAKFV